MCLCFWSSHKNLPLFFCITMKFKSAYFISDTNPYILWFLLCSPKITFSQKIKILRVIDKNEESDYGIRIYIHSYLILIFWSDLKCGYVIVYIYKFRQAYHVKHRLHSKESPFFKINRFTTKEFISLNFKFTWNLFLDLGSKEKKYRWQWG